LKRERTGGSRLKSGLFNWNTEAEIRFGDQFKLSFSTSLAFSWRGMGELIGEPAQ